MKQFRMLAIGLIAGVMLTISATSFAAGSISKIEAYLREGFTFKVNGETATLQNTPIVYNNTSYMPVRELAGMLGYEVGFEDNTITLDAKQPQSKPAATEQTKEVNDVTTETKETNVIDVDLSEWMTLDDLRELYGIGRKIDIPDGQDRSSNYRSYTLSYGDKIEIFFVPSAFVLDHMVTNDNGNKLLFKREGTFVEKSFVSSFVGQ